MDCVTGATSVAKYPQLMPAADCNNETAPDRPIPWNTGTRWTVDPAGGGHAPLPSLFVQPLAMRQPLLYAPAPTPRTRRSAIVSSGALVLLSAVFALLLLCPGPNARVQRWTAAALPQGTRLRMPPLRHGMPDPDGAGPAPRARPPAPHRAPTVVERVARLNMFMGSLWASPWLRGSSRRDLLEVRPTAYGRGVFAAVPIPRGTALGQYPGVRRSRAEFTAKNVRTGKRAEKYSVLCRDGWWCDPTDAAGAVAGPPARVWLGPLAADATLALTNEPPGDAEARRRGINCILREVRLGVFEMVTLRDVDMGEELLWDYGPSYNRSHYG